MCEKMRRDASKIRRLHLDIVPMRYWNDYFDKVVSRRDSVSGAMSDHVKGSNSIPWDQGNVLAYWERGPVSDQYVRPVLHYVMTSGSDLHSPKVTRVLSDLRSAMSDLRSVTVGSAQSMSQCCE